MGFGQYHQSTTILRNRREEAGIEHKDRDSGFPVEREKVKTGRMTDEEIMRKVSRALKEEIVESFRSAHNEITYTLKEGTTFCRYRETDIVMLAPSKYGTLIMLDTGGWNTISTRRHMRDFLSRHGFQITVWGDKKAGGNVAEGNGVPGGKIVFKESCWFLVEHKK